MQNVMGGFFLNQHVSHLFWIILCVRFDNSVCLRVLLGVCVSVRLAKNAFSRVCVVHITKTLQLCCSSSVLFWLELFIFGLLFVFQTTYCLHCLNFLIIFFYIYLRDMVLALRLQHCKLNTIKENSDWCKMKCLCGFFI